MSGRTFIEAGGSFSARHRCVEGELHEHTWTVRARFEVSGRVDARCYRASLQSLLTHWDGKELPEGADWNEDVAAVVGKLVNCVQVSVWREADQLGCVWIAL